MFQSRLLAVSGGRVSFKERKIVPIVGVLWRDKIFEKCFVNYSEIDPKPENITATIANIVEEVYFTEKQIKLVLFFNSILAGLGILDLNALQKTWNVPIIVLTEAEPDNDKIKKLIMELEYDESYLSVLEQNPSQWVKHPENRLFILPIGLPEEEAITILNELQIVGDLPEPLRVADIIAKAIH